MTTSLIENLRTCTGLSDTKLCAALAKRSGYPAPGVRLLRAWQSGDTHLPVWVERECMHWLVEIWQAERNGCNAQQLLHVDRKYLAMLSDFSMSELMQWVQRAQRG